VAVGGEPTHVGAALGDEDLGGPPVDPGMVSRRTEGPDLLPGPSPRVRDPDAGGDGGLVDVESRALRDDPLHRPLTSGDRRSVSPGGAPFSQVCEVRARSDSSGCLRLPRPTHKRARGTSQFRRRPGDHRIFIRVRVGPPGLMAS
jgi:hypothetical protein